MEENDKFIFICKTNSGQYGLLTEKMNIYLQIFDEHLLEAARKADVKIELKNTDVDEQFTVVPMEWLALQAGLTKDLQEKLCNSIESGILKFYKKRNHPDVPTVKQLLNS